MQDILLGLPSWGLVATFAVTALVVTLVSIKATSLADAIADRTGLGEAMVGAVVLGGATSLSGVVVSVTVAAQGDASFAISNAVGGIAAQTLFLAIGDAVYRRANLEHAAAEPATLFQAVLLIILLSLPLCAIAGPEISYLGIHPVSVVMFLAYLAGLKAASAVRENPMWVIVRTPLTRYEADDPTEDRRPLPVIFGLFAALVVVMAAAGWVISQLGTSTAVRFGLSTGLVGSLLTAVITSLPELVTTLTAIRRGALQLAVGGIIGGNTFDTLFLVASDVAYRDGSLYHAAARTDLYWLGTGLLMTSILLAGLVLRQRQGFARIGWESTGLVVIYATALAVQVAAGG
ncbi:cation:H+ antiporter [Hasllibacter halocynthiae]|uniref:Cation:H+ antiporter n=1 Tax=Hasllibacter halocynthiae TaxID=595589 RepID=A0A2T0X1N0_9RHOB|nr:cation transporter [Hasllibacter halocynthiae]PRY92856.1 cation:H+ antiporter [Hasllibacter halocynthiae]